MTNEQIQFPSPCGDKLQCNATDTYGAQTEFPSPCGDKLQWVRKGASPSWVCFRPLAGINCNDMRTFKMSDLHKFSSPCGDKL